MLRLPGVGQYRDVRVNACDTSVASTPTPAWQHRHPWEAWYLRAVAAIHHVVDACHLAGDMEQACFCAVLLGDERPVVRPCAHPLPVNHRLRRGCFYKHRFVGPGRLQDVAPVNARRWPRIDGEQVIIEAGYEIAVESERTHAHTARGTTPASNRSRRPTTPHMVWATPTLKACPGW